MGHVGPSRLRTTEYSALPYTMGEMTSLICTNVSSRRHSLSNGLTDGGKAGECLGGVPLTTK